MFDPELYKYSIYSNVFVDLNEHMIQKHNRGKSVRVLVAWELCARCHGLYLMIDMGFK